MFNHILPKGTTLDGIDLASSEFRGAQYDESGEEYQIVSMGKSFLHEKIAEKGEGTEIRYIEAILPETRHIFTQSITEEKKDFITNLERTLSAGQYYFVADVEFEDDFQPPLFNQITGELYYLGRVNK